MSILLKEIERIEAMAENKRDCVKLANFWKMYALEMRDEYKSEIESLRAQLTKPQPTPSQSEPVGEVGYLDDELVGYLRSDIEIPHGTKLYTKPQPTSQDVLNAIEQAKIDYAYEGKSLEWRRGFDAAMKESK